LIENSLVEMLKFKNDLPLKSF